jgi:hypothetical protein
MHLGPTYPPRWPATAVAGVVSENGHVGSVCLIEKSPEGRSHRLGRRTSEVTVTGPEVTLTSAHRLPADLAHGRCRARLGRGDRRDTLSFGCPPLFGVAPILACVSPVTVARRGSRRVCPARG